MRLLHGAKRYIGVLIFVCSLAAWRWIQKESSTENAVYKTILSKPSSTFTHKRLAHLDVYRNGSKKLNSNLAHGQSGNKIINNNVDVSSTFEHSSWKFDNDDHPKRIYEWNETVVSPGILPLVDKLSIDFKQPKIVFNRVGKCGSRSVLDIFRILAERNQFNMIESLVYSQKLLPPEKEEMMAQVISQLQAPYLFQRHMYHINFSYYGLQTPTYINIIRDPISRFTSQYYYTRFGDGKDRSWTFNGTENDKYQTINECVLRDKYECSERRSFYIVPYFCGNDRRCKIPSEWTLKRAMVNVKKNFKVIGLLEELRDTFLILEKMWPKMFRGCVDLLDNPSEGLQQNRTAALTKAKERPSPRVISILKEKMNIEYRFYDFVKSRFHMLKKKMGIGVR